WERREQCVVFRRGEIRTDKIKLRLLSIKRSMTDQKHEHHIVCIELRLQRREALFDFLSSGRLIGQHSDILTIKPKPPREHAAQLLRPLIKLLRVNRLSTRPIYNDRKLIRID